VCDEEEFTKTVCVLPNEEEEEEEEEEEGWNVVGDIRAIIHGTSVIFASPFSASFLATCQFCGLWPKCEVQKRCFSVCLQFL
jgi:hypothetical protein